MKKKVSLLFGLIMMFVFGFVISQSIYNLNKVDVEILFDTTYLLELARTNNPQQVFVDLREQEDYEAGHIDNFINVPSKSGLELDDYLQKNNLKNKYIYIICYSGMRSSATFNYLLERGYKHLVYISFGYEDFLDRQNDYIPETGPCSCLPD